MSLSFGVITPVKLPSPHLEATIESVKRSGRSINVTHYIVVDSTTAAGLKLPPALKATGQNYRILVTENNRSPGPSGARNTALDICTEDVVAFIDADDVWTEDYLSKLQALYSSDPDIAMVSTPGYKFGNPNSDGQLVQPWFDEGSLKTECLIWNPIGCPTGFSFRAAANKSAVRFPEGMWYCEDFAFYLLLFSQTEHKCYRLNTTSYRYRVSASQSLSNVSVVRLDSSKRAITQVLACLHDSKLSGSISAIKRNLNGRLARLEGRASMYNLLMLLGSKGWLRGQLGRWKRDGRLGVRSSSVNDAAM